MNAFHVKRKCFQGWSWFLKLHHELKKSSLDSTHRWSEILQPLADHLVESYLNFLPSLVYPVRVGEHSNTAFGLIFPLEYAQGLNKFSFATFPMFGISSSILCINKTKDQLWSLNAAQPIGNIMFWSGDPPDLAPPPGLGTPSLSLNP